MSNKRSDFLWIVQMIMIKHKDSIVGWSGVAGDAVAASYAIPIDRTARDAALDFCGVLVEGFDGDEKAPVPDWMVNLSEPTN
ncbi:hypothetical protein [Acidimangrovimonas sediminis]|uniref:hypothetical protein n=1 Tax=Acidimangrovimonas sediminis TaxID=2056283 RepID=UPI0011AEEB07|nr:hypothetical protein [Acidimangrovimonas sediminis]